MENITAHKNIVKSSDVVGVSVINTQKENLGKVYEVVLDKLTGQVHYVVLESGSFLGMGGKFFAIPWKAFKYDTTEHSFIVNISKTQLKNAPGFDKDNWPITSDAKWGNSINSYYDSLVS